MASPRPATVARRMRAVFYNVLDMASTGKGRLLAANPLNTMKWTPPDAAEKVDHRVVCNPRQARELLTALSYVGSAERDRGRRLVAMFACMYYAALRPAEAVNLHKADCELPRSGWGRLYVAPTTTEVGKRYTDSGALHNEKGLKHRPDDEVARQNWSPSSAGISRSSAPRRTAVCSASLAAVSSARRRTPRRNEAHFKDPESPGSGTIQAATPGTRMIRANMWPVRRRCRKRRRWRTSSHRSRARR